MIIPMLDGVKVVVIPHTHLKDSNEISVGDGYMRKTLAAGVPDDVALLFARAYITQGQHLQLVSLVRDMATASDIPDHWRGAASALLVRLLGDDCIACPVHGQYHPCAKCADDYHEEQKKSVMCPKHPAELVPCALCNAASQVPENVAQAVSEHARIVGWLPLTEVTAFVSTDHDDETRCVVVSVDLENPTDLGVETATLSELRRDVFNRECYADGWWRPVMDAPPAVEWTANMVKES